MHQQKIFELTVSPYRRRNPQQKLWSDEPTAGHGSVRVVIGNLFEELTAEFFGGTRHKNSGSYEYCPDVSLPRLAPTPYLECKGAGKTNQTFIYKGRLLKDKDFAVDHLLFYVVWHHGAVTRDCDTVRGVERAVLASLRAVYLIPFADVWNICMGVAPTPLNSKYGGSDVNPLYGAGYRIPLATLAKHRIAEFEHD